MLDEQRRDRQLIERGVMDILGDTFSIYWRHFRKFIVLVAVIQVPMGILGLLVTLIAPDSQGFLVSIAVIDGSTYMLVYAAVISAIGQHYLVDGISVAHCYTRTLWRIVSVLIFTAPLVPLFAIVLWQAIRIADLYDPAQSPETIDPEVAASILAGTGVLAAIGVALLVYAFYLVTVMPATIVEGYRFQGALRRGSQLLQGSRMRVLGHLLVYSLVFVGMIFTFTIPALMLGAMITGDSQTFLASIISIILNVIVSILVTPIIFIAVTLLYYDLRVRKENYDMERLSTEMGYERA